MLSESSKNSTCGAPQRTRNSLPKNKSSAFASAGIVLDRVTSSWPLEDWIAAEILVAVSGGPDSVALVRLLQCAKELHGQQVAALQIVHVNHRTQANNERDQLSVTKLANELGVPIHVIARQTGDAEASEDELRQFRYNAILETAKRLGIRLVATGHTADDQIETLLFRLARGTGLYGLQGIPGVRVHDGISIVRPLLKVRKCELLSFLCELDQPYCTDKSNFESSYSRNYLRNEIIPALSEKFGGQFDGSLSRIANQAREHVELLDQLASPLLENSGRYHCVTQLAQAHPVVATHALRLIWRNSGFEESAMNAEKWSDLLAFIKQRRDGHLQLPGKVTAKVIGKQFSFEVTETIR